MTNDDPTQILQRISLLLTEALQLADQVAEHVIAVNVSHALELTIERLDEIGV